MKVWSVVGVVLFGMLSTVAQGASVYTQRLEDPTAVYLTPAKFDVHGDGVADDSAALQKAIDQVQETTRQGIVFLPEGRYFFEGRFPGRPVPRKEEAI